MCLVRICDVVPLLPLATGDRPQTTVGRVWIGTIDPHPLRPTARRCARTLDIGTAPREHRRRAPTAYGASRGREHGTCDRTVAMAMASWPGSIPMTQRPKQHHSGTFYRLNFSTCTVGEGSQKAPGEITRYRSWSGPGRSNITETMMGV